MSKWVFVVARIIPGIAAALTKATPCHATTLFRKYNQHLYINVSNLCTHDSILLHCVCVEILCAPHYMAPDLMYLSFMDSENSNDSLLRLIKKLFRKDEN